MEKQEDAKQIYSAGIQHYNTISEKYHQQSDIIIYSTGFIRALINDERMKDEYLSIVVEEMTKQMMARIVHKK